LAVGLNKELSKRYGVCLAALVALCGFPGLGNAGAQPCFAEGDADATIGGRITNPAKRPVANAEVRILDEHGDILKSGNCDGDGTFSITHRSCEKCSLVVIPDERTGLATALIDDVAGDESRNFMITLHRGFSVSGRVTFEGKGLKGVPVKVSPVEAAQEHVHGGGFAKTGRDGRFRMTLTPGKKMLLVLSDRYAGHGVEFTVTSDMELPDFVIK
jgi:hypothetical protein